VSQLDSYDVDATYGCWLWTGKTDRIDGRPLVWRGARPSAAHRVMYETHVGPIAEGLELDHECNDLRCVRPAHMSPVTRVENERRKRFAYRCRIKVCKNGHDMSINAMITPKRGRACRACSRGGMP
jgi:hypothetical protein